MNSVKDLLKNKSKLKQLAKVGFDAVDTDKSGAIEFNELKVIMTRIAEDVGGDPPQNDDVEEVMKELDKDNNGTIDLDEFCILIKDVLRCLIGCTCEDECQC